MLCSRADSISRSPGAIPCHEASNASAELPPCRPSRRRAPTPPAAPKAAVRGASASLSHALSAAMMATGHKPRVTNALPWRIRKKDAGSHHPRGVECGSPGRRTILVHRQGQEPPPAVGEPIKPCSSRVCDTGTDIDQVRGVEGRGRSVALDHPSLMLRSGRIPTGCLVLYTRPESGVSAHPLNARGIRQGPRPSKPSRPTCPTAAPSLDSPTPAMPRICLASARRTIASSTSRCGVPGCDEGTSPISRYVAILSCHEPLERACRQRATMPASCAASELRSGRKLKGRRSHIAGRRRGIRWRRSATLSSPTRRPARTEPSWRSGNWSGSAGCSRRMQRH